MAVKNLLVEKLRHLYASDDTFKGVLDDFAGRERNSWDSSVERVSQRTGLSRGEVIRVFKALGDAGNGEIGRFVVGRRGQSSRFEWEKSSLSVGRVAAGEDLELEDRPADEDEIESEEGEMKIYPFPLRKDLEIELALPLDLTQREAKRIAE